MILPYGYMNHSMPVKATLSIQKRFEVCLSLAQKYFQLAINNGTVCFIIESMRNLQQLFFLRTFYKCIAGKDIQNFTENLVKNAGKKRIFA